MKGQALTALAASLLLLHTSAALQLVKRDFPAVVGLDIQRRNVLDPVKRDLLKRAGTVSETLDNEATLYFANISLGTPAQKLRMHIDTGSSDLWTNAASSQLCQRRGDLCGDSGTYDANSSSTYTFVSSDFNISYVDGSGALGDYATDTLQFGGKSLKNFQFGIGYESSSPEGVLGIGYPVNEVQVNRNGNQPYANLPQAMVNDGLIQTPAFSLWLNDLDASTGNILFGGVNTDKFHGGLSTLPIEPEGQTESGNSVFAEFIIALTDVTLTQGSKSQSMATSELPAPVLLDSGSSLTYLPDNMAQQIWNVVGAQYDNSQGTAYAPCSLANIDATLDFTFSSPKISVPMNELIINPGPAENGGQLTLDNGDAACIFGIAPAQGSTPVLGDTFLRSAYVVYDLDNNEISIAQTNFNSTSDNILEIGNSVPQATKVMNAVTSLNVNGGGARIGAPTGGSFTLTGSVPSGTTTGAALPTQIPLRMAAGVAGAGLLLAVL